VMPHEVKVDEALGIVVARFEGTTLREEVMQMVDAARTAAAARGMNILYDMRAARPGISSGELFWFPREVPALREPLAGRIRVATLSSLEGMPIAKVWETVFRNAGLQAQAFSDEAAALAWLRPVR
jgi:hypothetical protein